MNYTQLSLQQSPDLWTPLRFFISAPIFAIFAIILVLIAGPEVLHNRWLPETLAVTHLLSLGFISMMMMGATFQLLPVLAGCDIYKSKISSKIIFLFVVTGVGLFTIGLAISGNAVIKTGLFFLVPGLLGFLILTTYALFKAKSEFASATGMRLAINSFWIAFLLGVLLAIGTAWDSFPLLRQLTSIHVVWAALGWVTIMIVAIAYQVIPMFQVTQEYPDKFKKYYSRIMFVCLLVLSSLIYLEYSLQFIVAIISLSILAFSFVSINLILKRKKRLVDAGTYFWLTGLGSLILCVLIFNYDRYYAGDLSVLTGYVFFYGFVISVINGMLFKIVPFLVWLNLNKERSRITTGLSSIPTMNEVISRKKMLYQYYIHLSALLLTLTSFLIPTVFFHLGAVLWGLSLAVLNVYMYQSVRLYYSVLNRKV
ncbi:MAG: hypothetical protein OQK98_13105 [Gammaproteobacteria bacterium]|nr:hypothetical protein [Gammaproteobacteria bacterium]